MVITLIPITKQRTASFGVRTRSSTNASDPRESRLKQRLSDIVRHSEIHWMLYRLSELSVRRHKCAPEVAGRARSEGTGGGLSSNCSMVVLLDYLALWHLGSGMIIANMRFKLLVALQLEVLLHFL